GDDLRLGGTVSFNQNGGTVTLLHEMNWSSGSVPAVYNLNGGTLNAGSITVGILLNRNTLQLLGDGAGTLNINGGALIDTGPFEVDQRRVCGVNLITGT